MEQTKVYIIIVTYNAMKWMDKCLGSLQESEMPCVPVIVDNLSQDETVSYIREHYPEVHLIVNKENRGFGQANNQGIEWAYAQGATHFFLLNQDAWVHKDTIRRLVEVQNNYSIAIISPIHLNGAGDKMDSMFFKNVYVAENNLSLASDALLQCYRDYYEVKYVNAAAWMISRNCIETIGGFDPLFFHYGEDSNYIHRLSFHHKSLAVVPNVFVNHDRGEHGNIDAYKKHLYARRVIVDHANINKSHYSLDRKRVRTLLSYSKDLTVSIITLKWKRACLIIEDILIILSKTKAIKESRKNNIEEKANWLNIN